MRSHSVAREGYEKKDTDDIDMTVANIWVTILASILPTE